MQKIAGLVLTVLVVGGLAWGIRAYQQKPAETSGSGAAPSTQAQDGLVLIPQGTFTMGSPDSERQREKDETAHEVSVSAFYLSPTEVTQEQYQQVMGENPSHFQGQQLPVENVTWYQAVEFCNKLSSQKGLTPAYQVNGNTVTWDRSADGYRLPTEAEWEYAARAGTHSIYYFGNQINSDQANFEGDYPYLIEENYVVQRDPKVVPSANRGKTIPVDQLPANAFGLHNMLGNVSEWVFDYYGPYGTSPQKDPAGAEKGSLRVNRGGGYNDFGKHLRAAYRSATNPLDHDQTLGFRICRNAQPGKGLVKTTGYARPAPGADCLFLLFGQYPEGGPAAAGKDWGGPVCHYHGPALYRRYLRGFPKGSDAERAPGFGRGHAGSVPLRCDSLGLSHLVGHHAHAGVYLPGKRGL